MLRNSPRAPRIAALAAAAALILPTLQAPPAQAAGTPADVLPTRATQYAPAQPPRIAPGILPPTNSWISGAVFNREGLSAPTWVGGGLAFRAKPTSFGVAVPELWHYGDKAIIAGWERNGDPPNTEGQSIALAPAGASDYRLTRVDDISADLTWRSGDRDLGTLTAVEGWPYVQYRAAASHTVSSNRPLTQAGPNHWTWTAPTGQVMHVVGTGASLSGSTFSLPAGAMLHVFGEPKGATASDVAALVAGAVRLTGTKVDWGVSGGRASTTFTLATDGGRPTVFTQVEHQNYGLATLKGRWENPTGWASGVVGSRFSFSVPAFGSARDVDLTKLTDAQRGELRGLVRADAGKVTQFKEEDTYFGGKELFRAVNVYRLAKQLGMSGEAGTVKAAIEGQLNLWLDASRCRTQSTKCFTYDETLKTVVGQKESFGSGTNANDHHFHYGYFLYAAGMLGLDDPSLVSRYRPVADALMADIASTTETATTIKRRAFDDWRGHSWANGTGGGFDGNDQESSSEAVNAWAGLDLWARASGASTMSAQASWMMSNEAATAKAYWFDPYRRGAFAKTHVSMMFQGKVDYGTWWSPDASDILGIQVIPLGPTQIGYLKSLGKARITELFDAVLAQNPQVAGRSHLIDWNIMLLALGDQARARELAGRLTDADIDNANTRSYLYAIVNAAAASDNGASLPAPPEPEPTPGPTDPGPTTPAPSPTPTAPQPSEPAPEPSPQPTDHPGGTADAFAGLTVAHRTGGTVGVQGSRFAPAKNGDWVRFRTDFGTKRYTDAAVRVASGAAGGVSGLVEVRTGSPTGRVLGSLALANTGGWDADKVVPFNVAGGLTGVQDVYVTFTSGQPSAFAALTSLVFRTDGSQLPPTGPTGPAPAPSGQPAPSVHDAFAGIPAAAASGTHGVAVASGRLGPAGNGSWASYEVDFGAGGARDAVVRAASGASGGVSGLVQMRLDSPSGPVLGDLALANTGGWDAVRDVPFNVGPATGRHTLYVTFASGQPAAFVTLDRLTFRK